MDDYDPVQYERTGKITVEVWPSKNNLFLNDNWACGNYDSITIPDMEGKMRTYDISSVCGVKEWYQFYLKNAPFWSDKLLDDVIWQEWWKNGLSIMEQVSKLLPDYVTLYYLYEAKPIFLTTSDGNPYWNCKKIK